MITDTEKYEGLHHAAYKLRMSIKKKVVHWKKNSTVTFNQWANSKLSKLDDQLHFYHEHTEAVISDANSAISEAVEQADKTIQALETQLQQALMVAEDKLKSSVHSLSMHKAVEKAEQLVLEATIAKLNQQQAIQQHQLLADKNKNLKLANIEKMAGFVVDAKLANAVQAIAQLRQAILVDEPAGEQTVPSQSACKATVTVNKLEHQIVQLLQQ
uniref:Uncharacterized protein n=1 Tax=Ditylenchus dipsaci TaxID=166011 RepID=A0A915EPS2_9BILA